MNERKPPEPFILPCMYKNSEPCVECNAYAPNADNLRQLARNKYVKRVMNREGIDKPAVKQISVLLFGLDLPFATIFSDALETSLFVSPQLRSLGREIADLRKETIIHLSEVDELDIHCPNYEQKSP